MKKLLVHFHVYYHDQVDWFVQKLANITGVDYDMVVTMSRDNEETRAKLKRFKPKFVMVPNKGYDVGPFIDVLNRTDLSKYDYILKLHTKRIAGINFKVGKYYYSGKWWRRILVDALIGSKEMFRKNMKMFERDGKLGMIGSRYLALSEKTSLIAKTEPEIYDYVGRGCEYVTCVCGTMFIVRAHLMAGIKRKYTLADFDDVEKHIRRGTFAHVMERLLGHAVTEQGYRIDGFEDRSRRFEASSVLSHIARFFFVNKVTRRGRRIIKIFKIPVWYSKAK
ncbi:MAG: rhamnan synthesis F family protein [Rickettsiales bacterium]|jgi:lipopolysaccharide biosynthesis protein|nr:rhamnan synthesis F family protein [Rickettsiales bacterium]